MIPWSEWWVWFAGAVILGVIEVMMPTQIVLGFSIGAVATGLALLIGVPGLAGSLPATLLVFAILSLIAWLVLRRAVGVREGQVKVWDRDINED